MFEEAHDHEIKFRMTDGVVEAFCGICADTAGGMI